MPLTPNHREYWRRNLRMTAALFAVWFLVTFGIGWYARDLAFDFFGWPFSFYMAAQGAQIVYVLIIGFYARYMNRLDRTYDVYEHEDAR